mmetsp:Transcript_112259/g.311981  ORF Transcript_112259/g.311981 Transcript_112259/m.311981 type:complete len:209 (-) Transcript_112259:76-702(-)
MVTQAVGWRNPAHGFVPFGLFRVFASAKFVPGSARAKLYRDMEQAFSREWLRADSGLRHPKSGARLTNAQSLVRRGAKEYYAKAAEGLDPDNGVVAAVAQIFAVATHHVAAERLQALAEHLVAEGCPVLVVCAGNDLLVRYANQRRLATALGPAVAELLDLSDSSHGVTDERRGEVNAAISRLLAAAERQRPPDDPKGGGRVRVRSRL